jgi:porin
MPDRGQCLSVQTCFALAVCALWTAPVQGQEGAAAPDAEPAAPAAADEPGPATDPAAGSGSGDAEPGADPATEDGDQEIGATARGGFEGPNQTDRQLEEDDNSSSLLELDLLDEYSALKATLTEETGLTIGGDYSALYHVATERLNERSASSGMFRLYGSWELLHLLGAGEETSGKVAFKVENRHRYSNLPPQGFSLDLGHVGVVSPPFSNETWRLTHLYWRQSFASDRVVVYAGLLDSTDFVDAYILASPWTGFSNFVFSTGAGAIDLPNDGALGVMAGVWLTEQVYLTAGFTDANSDPHDPFHRLFSEVELFKYVELGWTGSRDEFFLTKVHVTVWHKDERDDAGVPRGWGVNGSATIWLADMLLPFLRGGWSQEGGGLFEASISAGIGLQWKPGGDVIGIGLNWGQPNEEVFGDVDDQVTGEIFYRWRLTDHVEFTPVVSLFIDPALNPDDDVIAVFGFRGRVSF